MNLPKPFTPSERYARNLLAAWYKRQDDEFLAQLNAGPSIRDRHPSYAEQERVDLIRDLGGNLKVWKQSNKEEELNAALHVMHQLARWNGHADATSSI